MQSRILLSVILIASYLAAGAQQQCARTMIFFDYGKSELKKEARSKLDSLSKAIGKGTFIVELSGHADSINTEEFNMKLSQDRIKSVEGYLKKKNPKASLTIKQFPRGETRPFAPNDTEPNRAKNRRVDVYLISPDGDKLVFKGDKNESLEIPADFAGPACSVCEALKLTFLHNDNEARSANVPLKTSTGRELTTTGMMQFSFECPDKAATCLPVKYTMPSQPSLRWECLSAATLARGGNWEKSSAQVQPDRASGTFTTTESCYKLGSWSGINKPLVDLCQHQLNFPADLTIMKTKVYSNDSVFFIEPSSAPATYPCGQSHRMFSWAKGGDAYFFLKAEWNMIVTTRENKGNCDTLFTYNLTKESYTPVPVSDTTVFAKFKGFSSLKSPAYYVEELDLQLPLANVKKTTYSANYLNYEHRLRFEGDGKTYNLKYSDVKSKYKKGKKKLKVTVKKNKLSAVEVVTEVQ